MNNTRSSVQVHETVETTPSHYSLSSADTTDSYQTREWILSEGARPTITVAGKSISVEDGAGYEIYHAANGAISLRRLRR